MSYYLNFWQNQNDIDNGSVGDHAQVLSYQAKREANLSPDYAPRITAATQIKTIIRKWPNSAILGRLRMFEGEI